MKDLDPGATPDELLYPITNDRHTAGIAHERQLIDRLQHEGWLVAAWGLGVLPRPMRALITNQTTPLRNWPDLIAARGNATRIIEAKSRRATTNTPNHAIQNDSLEHLQALETIGLPVVIVWHDFTVNKPSNLRPFHRDDNPTNTAGSGTPYSLVRRADQRPWTWAFPAP